MISFKYHVCASDYFFFFSDQRTEMLLSQSSMHSLLPDESWARYPAWRAAICTNTVNNFTFWNNKHERQHLLTPSTFLFKSRETSHTLLPQRKLSCSYYILFSMYAQISGNNLNPRANKKLLASERSAQNCCCSCLHCLHSFFSSSLSGGGSGSVRGLPPLKETFPGAPQTTSGRRKRRRRRRGHLRRSFQLSLALSYFFLSKRGSQRTRSRVSAPAVAGFWTE